MANKIHNQLIGTAILIAVSVIILLNLLNGKKKIYKKDEFTEITLEINPVKQQDKDATLPVTQSLVAQSPAEIHIEQSKLKSIEVSKQVEQKKSQSIKQSKQDEPSNQTKRIIEKNVPIGTVYVVQLGALKNAAKVNEIVALLNLSGYRTWTVPSTPVHGQITRIYIGPDTSKLKMQAAIVELKSISGLRGIVKSYNTTR